MSEQNITWASTTVPGEYEYTRLDIAKQQIRLFWIEMDDEGSAQGRLEHLDLGSAPKYRALSYTWGDALPLRQITISSRTFTVRDNLDRFLKLFKICYPGEFIWIDQLCIDQSHAIERNAQVSMMSQIYQRASEVLVWLCQDTAQSCKPDCRQVDIHQHGAECPLMVSLLTQPYWARVWIIQELVLAKRIILLHGAVTLEWSDLGAIMQNSLHVDEAVQLWCLKEQVMNKDELDILMALHLSFAQNVKILEIKYMVS